ncbi:hypothetical protein Goshw_020628 [Gossypium schwendimanii]|uniref:MADS-box domain-containing protein n=2 Tax=Gossypium TaxID=3633 RepID=A0A7J9N2Q5_GOSSC|nr:hypothetical protein [Gossypium aridum]MBA0877356.1 hypothetical protein [Gossypium schwendimanii]
MEDVAMLITTEAKKARSSRGRQRIEIKKLEVESKRQVTFSKRRQGLFKKAKELSTLCGADVGVLTISKSGRVYTTDDVDIVLDRRLAESSSSHGNDSVRRQNEVVERRTNAGFGLDELIENLAVEKLVEYVAALKELREKAAFRLEELSIQDSSYLWPFVADREVNKDEFVNNFMAEVKDYN